MTLMTKMRVAYTAYSARRIAYQVARTADDLAYTVFAHVAAAEAAFTFTRPRMCRVLPPHAGVQSYDIAYTAAREAYFPIRNNARSAAYSAARSVAYVAVYEAAMFDTNYDDGSHKFHDAQRNPANQYWQEAYDVLEASARSPNEIAFSAAYDVAYAIYAAARKSYSEARTKAEGKIITSTDACNAADKATENMHRTIGAEISFDPKHKESWDIAYDSACESADFRASNDVSEYIAARVKRALCEPFDYISRNDDSGQTYEAARKAAIAAIRQNERFVNTCPA